MELALSKQQGSGNRPLEGSLITTAKEVRILSPLTPMETNDGTLQPLRADLEAWRSWAAAAAKEENGWESDAPNWATLVAAARITLLTPNLDPEDISCLATAFELSTEGEALADSLKENFRSVPVATIVALANSPSAEVRWQVFDSIATLNVETRELLLRALEHEDSCVRRRAFLRLTSLEVPPSEVLHRAALDNDPVIRDRAASL